MCLMPFYLCISYVICTDRLKKQELASVALSAKNLLREVEESAKVDVGNTPQDSLEPDLDDQTPIASKERAKIVISVRDSDKEELKQFRLFVVCSCACLHVFHNSEFAFFDCNHPVLSIYLMVYNHCF